MQNVHSGIVWIAIVSTLLAGCFSTSMIEPEEYGSVDPASVESVLLKSGVEKEFVTTVTITDTAVVYQKEVSIPISDILRYDSGDEGGVVHMDRLIAVTTKTGERFEFIRYPKFSEEALVWSAANHLVAIPLSDVQEVHVRGFSYGRTALLIVGLGVILVSIPPGSFGPF